MVVENQRRMEWVARQWGSWTERDVILNAVRMLREERTLAGRLLQMVEQLYGNHEYQMTSYIA